mmetsp:Transcript_8470/g.9377  ORF Transcript_8470/g.9377 Transcript_8470/m.9377 type:complete len:335 (+) Transcript_8470:91-1095(+)
MISQRKQRMSSFLAILLTTTILQSNRVLGFSLPSQRGNKRLHCIIRTATMSTSPMPVHRSRSGRHRNRERERKQKVFEPHIFIESSTSDPILISSDNSLNELLHDEGKIFYAIKTTEKFNDVEEWEDLYNNVLWHYVKRIELPSRLQSWRDSQRKLLYLSVLFDRKELRSPTKYSTLGLLSRNQVEKLQGFPDEIMGLADCVSWDDWYSRMVDHYLKHGHLFHPSKPIFEMDKTEELTAANSEALSEWIQLQRTLVDFGLLHTEQLQLLWSINFCWDTSEADFFMQYQRLLQLEENRDRQFVDIANRIVNGRKPYIESDCKQSYSVRQWKKLQK